MDWIINSDFFIFTMIDVMSPLELYHFRLTTSYLYKNITLKDIDHKIILCVKQRLKYELKEQYDYFMNIMKLRKMCLYGPMINEAIWGEYNNIYIDVKMLDINMGNDENIFKDLNKIYENDHQRLYQQFSDWFIHDSDKSISINKIRLYIISDHHYNYPNFPPIFQNELTMDWELKLYNLKAVMYKKYIDSDYDYYDYSWFKHEECESKETLCQKYKLN